MTLPERLFCVRVLKAQHRTAPITSDLVTCGLVSLYWQFLTNWGSQIMTLVTVIWQYIHSTAHYSKCLWGFLISNNLSLGTLLCNIPVIWATNYLSLGQQCLRFPPSSSFTVSCSRWEYQRHNQSNKLLCIDVVKTIITITITTEEPKFQHLKRSSPPKFDRIGSTGGHYH